MTRIFLFALLVLCIGIPARADVCVVYAMDANGKLSSASETYCLNADGTVATMPYWQNGHLFSCDGIFTFQGQNFYCGKNFADLFLQYAANTNQ